MLAVIVLITLVRIAFLAAELRPLEGDEAQYWSWSLDPAFGYYSKPPMVAWLIGLTTAIAGHGEFGIRLASPLVHAVTAFMVFLIGRRLFADARIGFWAGLVYATLPGVSFSATVMSTDPPLLMFWSIALYAFIRAVDADDWRWWVGCGAALGLALLSKYSAIAFPVSALCYLLLSGGHRRLLRRPGPWLMLTAAAVVLAPNLVWNAGTGFVTVAHVGENANLGGPLLQPGKMAEFIGSQFGVFGPILFGALLVMLARWGRVTRDDRMLLLLSFVVPLLAAITAQSLLSRAHANWAAPVYVAATVAVTAWLARPGRMAWLAAAVALHVVAGTAIYGFEGVRAVTGIGTTAALDPFRRARGWDDAGAAVAQVRAAHDGVPLLADERMMLARFLYYADVPLAETYKWNPDGVIEDHYELTTTLQGEEGRDFLLVTRLPDRAAILDRFARAEQLPPIRVQTHDDRAIDLSVFLLRGFRGYAAASAGAS